jgi:hypothetical protein
VRNLNNSFEITWDSVDDSTDGFIVFSFDEPKIMAQSLNLLEEYNESFNCGAVIQVSTFLPINKVTTYNHPILVFNNCSPIEHIR